jgi:hypothetical protein
MVAESGAALVTICVEEFQLVERGQALRRNDGR